MRPLKKGILIVTIIVLILFNGFDVWRNLSVSEPIHKTAIFFPSLLGKSFIICKYNATTGSKWVVCNENGMPTYKLCNIVGVEDPFHNSILGLNYEFQLGGNAFVFYLSADHTKAIAHDGVYEYSAIGWDILYPVRRDNPFSTSPSMYIIESDLR